MSHEEAILPQSLMRVLPEDPYEQLDLARKIASMALSNRLSVLENRVGYLRNNLEEKDKEIEHLQERISQVEQSIQKANIRILKTTDDKISMSKENEVLQGTITKLKHDLSKMEAFRKSLVHTLRLDNHLLESMEEALPTQGALGSTKLKSTTSNDSPRSPLQMSLKGEDDISPTIPMHLAPADRRMLVLKARPIRKSISDFAKASTLDDYEYEHDVKHGVLTPPLSPPRSPPKSKSATGSPALSKRAPTSQHIPRPTLSATAPSSPPRSASLTRVDGKEFFRQAKNRLSYDQFRALLNTIKELNARLQTREDALRQSKEILGTENNDLYSLLCQHLTS